MARVTVLNRIVQAMLLLLLRLLLLLSLLPSRWSNTCGYPHAFVQSRTVLVGPEGPEDAVLVACLHYGDGLADTCPLRGIVFLQYLHGLTKINDCHGGRCLNPDTYTTETLPTHLCTQIP